MVVKVYSLIKDENCFEKIHTHSAIEKYLKFKNNIDWSLSTKTMHFARVFLYKSITLGAGFLVLPQKEVFLPGSWIPATKLVCLGSQNVLFARKYLVCFLQLRIFLNITFALKYNKYSKAFNNFIPM